jgi:mannose-6-phosphate isomerase-like protein (cupin superfamily)
LEKNYPEAIPTRTDNFIGRITVSGLFRSGKDLQHPGSLSKFSLRWAKTFESLGKSFPAQPWRTRHMPRLIESPTRIAAHGNMPKIIDEFIGRVNSQTTGVSIARMQSPAGWEEPGQTPEFDEYTIVLKGTLHVESRDGQLTVSAGQAVIAPAGEWVRYSTPSEDGAEYIAVCLPAFSPETVNRDV